VKSHNSNLPSRRPLPARAAVIKREPGSLHTRLIEEGRKMFEENGASELSLRELARRVGVSEAAPSRHFRGKEELLAAIAVTGFEELAEERARIAALETSPVKRAREMMTSYVRFARAHPGIFHLMTGPRLLEEFVRGDIEATSNDSYRLFSESIYDLARASGWPEKQMELLAHAAWSMEHGLATLLLSGRAPRIDSDVDPEMMIDFAINTFLAAVVAGPEAFKKALGPLKK
jgi:AcrR family transcriptional regulator